MSIYMIEEDRCVFEVFCFCIFLTYRGARDCNSRFLKVVDYFCIPNIAWELR